jgi:hypothetical protein
MLKLTCCGREIQHVSDLPSAEFQIGVAIGAGMLASWSTGRAAACGFCLPEGACSPSRTPAAHPRSRTVFRLRTESFGHQGNATFPSPQQQNASIRSCLND